MPGQSLRLGVRPLAAWYDAGTEALLAMILVSTPIYFLPVIVSAFDPPKAILVRATALALLGWQVPRLVEAAIALSQWLGEPRATSGKFRLPPLPVAVTGAMILLAVVTAVSATVSVASWTSWWGSTSGRGQGAAITIAAIFVAWVLLDHARTPARLQRIISLVLIGGIPVLLYALGQRFGFDSIGWTSANSARPSST